MALRSRSLFLYGFEVTELNSSLDFKTAAFGPTLLATLQLGFYSLTSLGEEIVRALKEQAPAYNFTFSVDRTIAGGLENRITITTTAPYFDILFATGPRTASACNELIGFPLADKTGALTYTGNATAGISLVTEREGYNYLPPTNKRKVQGAVNISANGDEEAVVFSVMRFFQVEFKHEPETKVFLYWTPLMEWLIQHKLVEFTPEISSPSVFYEATILSTGADGKGLAFEMSEQLPEFPFYYQTGTLTFRQRVPAAGFI